MARLGPIEIDIRLTGDLAPVVQAFAVMAAALATDGHSFSPEDEATISRAGELLEAAYERARREGP